MPSLYRAKALVFAANIAALPTVGSDGYVYVINDDGAGNTEFAIWNPISSSWDIYKTAAVIAADFKTGRQAIGAAATTAVVAFGAAYADINYSISLSLLNATDVGPAHFTTMITAKAIGGFTVTLSGPTATANYVLEWSTKHD